MGILPSVFYRLQRGWGKIIFSVACQEFCPQGRVPGQVPPGQVQAQAGTPPGKEHPHAGTPPGKEHPHAGTPPGQVSPMVNEQEVSILLEWILVLHANASAIAKRSL